MDVAVAERPELQIAETKDEPEPDLWKKFPVYMGTLARLDKEPLLDVLKLTVRSRKIQNAPMKSLSQPCWQAKEDLKEDPLNLMFINNLGFQYLREGQHDQCLNVLMRGWKRAAEIQDEVVQFAFLMKACELSYGLWMYRQALAIYRDIREPSQPAELKPYFILGTQVWARNGDIAQALKCFGRAIDGVEINRAMRTFAVVSNDLRKAGAYEAARSTMESLLDDEAQRVDLELVDNFLESIQNAKVVSTPEQEKRRLMIAGVIAAIIGIILFLTWLEARSLRAMRGE